MPFIEPSELNPSLYSVFSLTKSDLNLSLDLLLVGSLEEVQEGLLSTNCSILFLDCLVFLLNCLLEGNERGHAFLPRM